MARQQLPPQVKKKTVRARETGKSVVRYEITATMRSRGLTTSRDYSEPPYA
jgi:hypothetical protein